MKPVLRFLLPAALVTASVSVHAGNETVVNVPPPSGTATVGNAPRETVAPAFANAIPNVPGKSLVAAVVTYPPGGKTPSHSHAKSAFITAYVLSGAVKSKVDDGPVKVYQAGESWSEAPGAHHVVSENASATEEAKLLAIFVVDTAEKELTTLDQKR
ncbi:MAG TPA: cupin domain-containing protein [Nevskiaceae bacterium]|nr:cupin domain-containing protein [Nevskiaceae bacterium]